MAPAMRELPPFPSGWYVLAFSSQLPPQRILARSFMGRELVLWRTLSGRAVAMDAYCPHLGAHFGHGGTVCGEQLRCPFHGFCFDAGGRCVATGYGSKPPPTATVASWAVRETNGMILVHHDAHGAAPAWEVPALAQQGWSRPVFRRFELAAHPQETTENSVDLGHFAHVHGYAAVRMLRDVVTDGPYLSTAFTSHRPLPLVGRWLRPQFDFDFETHIHGLGYSQVDVRVRGLDIRARLWVLPTPLDAGRLCLHLAASGYGGGDDVHRLLRAIPRRLRAAAIGRGLLHFLIADARQDFAIWQHKRYVQPPALAQGDGPIGRYRAWAAQFYGEPAATARQPVPLRATQ
jgi:nitrite reductase/ring-hydroxylating ferredoxin subunit